LRVKLFCLAQTFNRFLDTNFVVNNLDGSNLELQKENSSKDLIVAKYKAVHFFPLVSFAQG